MSTLPRKEDINVYDSLDERSAVKSFYGKTREEILARLPGEYISLQEDLANMGPVAFAYYAPAWEEFCKRAAAECEVEELDDIAEWTHCIITCRRIIWEEKETPEALAAMRRMLSFWVDFYNSEVCREYFAEQARFYGYAEELIANPPELAEQQEHWARLRAQLGQ